MYKNFFIIIVILFLNFIIYSNDLLSYEKIKKVINNSSDIEKTDFFSKIKNLKIEWKGYLLYTASYDDLNDMIFIEMDIVKPDPKKNQPDVCFLLNKKYSKKVDVYQQLYFIGEIENVDFVDNKYIIRINKIYLKNFRM